MARYQVMYPGLNKRETYDEVLNYLERGGGAGIDIAFPNRTASFIRNSPQYQNLLTADFVDLQKQQENVLKQQKRDIIIKEQSSGSDASMKSVLASETPAESLASPQVESDLSEVSAASIRAEDLWAEMDDQIDQMERNEQAKRVRQAMYSRVAEVTQQHEYLGGLRDDFAAASATGHEQVGATGNKKDDKHIAKGQQLDQLRVIQPGATTPPKRITELTKDPVKLEQGRQYLGLSQASSSSSNPKGSAEQFDISGEPIAKSGSRARSQSTKGTRNETLNPETSVAKPRGRPTDPNSERQKTLAAKASAISPGYPPARKGSQS
jgi:hypothetical protein